MEEIKRIQEPLKEEDVPTLSPEDALEMSYYEDSIIIKVNRNERLIDDIATCFNIEDTFDFLMLAPLVFLGRTDGIENEKEYKEKLWKQVRIFYREARNILDKRYRL